MDKTGYLILVVIVFFSCGNNVQDGVRGQFSEIQLESADGVQLTGWSYNEENATPTILLFHQGGSNFWGEYEPILPELMETGYNIFGLDARMGGQLYGHYNHTVAGIKKNEFTYCDALPDIEAAFQYVKEKNPQGKIILWGSSYSASLVIQLASKESNVNGVLAFSPASGGPMVDCRPDLFWAEINCPSLILRPIGEMQREASKAQFAEADSLGLQTYVAENGIHGSSMLVRERVGSEVDDNWKVVLDFLQSL